MLLVLLGADPASAPSSCSFVVRELAYSPTASAAAQDTLGRLESEAAAALAFLRDQAGRK